MASERTQGWVDGVVHRLIRRAAGRAPGELSERLEEEWQADLAERPGPLSRLRFAIGCCWAINVIAREHAVGVVHSAGVSAGNVPAAAVPDDPQFFSTRTTAFLLVVCLHVALVYGLAMGLGATLTKVISVPFNSHVIEKPRPKDPPPVPHQKFSTQTTIDVPPPEVVPLQPDVDPGIVRAAVPETPPAALPPRSVPAAVDRVQGGPGVGFPNTNDYYPDIEIRRGGAGVATVQACVSAKGRLTSEPTIIHSTGNAGLDQAALKLARAGSGHYRASTENGRPLDSCYPFRIRFELRN